MRCDSHTGLPLASRSLRGPRLCQVFLVKLRPLHYWHLLLGWTCPGPLGNQGQSPASEWDEQRAPPQSPLSEEWKMRSLRHLHAGRVCQRFLQPLVQKRSILVKEPSLISRSVGSGGEIWHHLRSLGFTIHMAFTFCLLFYFLGICGCKWLCFRKLRVQWKLSPFPCGIRLH